MKKILLVITLIFSFFNLSAQPTASKDNVSGKWGFRNKNGGWAIKPQFEEIDKYFVFSQSRKYAVVKQNGYWGCIDETGAFKVPALLLNNKIANEAGTENSRNKTDEMYEGFDRAKRLWGFINSKGQFVVPPTFTNVDHNNSFFTKKPYTIVEINGSWGAINKDGILFVKPYFVSKEDAISAAEEATAMEELGKNIYPACDPSTKKCGFVNYKGNWVVKPSLDNFDKGYTFSDNRPFAVVKLASGWGCVNRKGVFIVKPTYPKQEAARAAAYRIPNVNAAVASNLVPNYDDGKYKNSLKAGARIRIAEEESAAANTGSGHKAPTIYIISPKDGEGYTQQSVTITYEAKTFDGSQPKILAYVNGELQTTKGIQRTAKQITLSLPRSTGGVSRIQLIAKDGHGQNSDPASITLRYVGAEGKPGLHLLAVGVSDYNQADLKLQNAAKDAQDFINTIKGLGLDQYDKIVSSTLITDKEATDRNIKRNLSQLVSKVNQGDVIMLFFSGHGAKEGESTYFLSVNAESDDLFSSAVNFDDIKNATRRLKDKKCRIIVFMDACHSGALYGQKSIAENYALSEPGIIGFYSSTESQKSNESEKWENGIFTKSLLEGLKGKAADENGNITLDKLESYIREAVRKATNGTQMPIFENKQGNFVLFKAKP
ncbi:MAG: caspase family protein [Paludibacteraceae bacterium]|nr:caspase family protein [Paludibacteraceae bacterium]